MKIGILSLYYHNYNFGGELGVGSAMIYSMYKPIAEDNNTTICALMNLYRTYYRICADKLYPQFKPAGKVATEEKKAINGRIKDLFTSKIGSIIYDSADTIVISSFLGLTALAVYQNYFYILNAITSLITVVFSACTAGIGNSIVVETKEKNYRDLNKFKNINTFTNCASIGG